MTIKVTTITRGSNHMHNHFLHQFMKKEQDKREESRRNNQIFLVNQKLNNLLKQLMHKHGLHHSDEEMSKVIKYTSQYIVSSNIVNLSYRNNFESLEVAILQYLLIESILTSFNESKRSILYIDYELRAIDNYKIFHLTERHDKFFKGISFS